MGFREVARRMGAFVVLAVLAVVVAACGATPGGDNKNDGNAQQQQEPVKKFDPAKAGNVTLTVWDQEVRGGQRKQITELNRQFEAKYPNITIKRVAKSFTDLNTTLKLAVSGDKAPDVVEANQGRQVMGQLVKGGLLRPLDQYAKAYGWEQRWPKTLLDLNRFSADGKQFGTGNLYGVSQMGEIVGVYYNSEKVRSPPKTFAEFEQQLQQAKDQGDIPIQFGDLDKWPGIHEFETVQAQFAPKEQVRDFVFAKSGATFDSAENQQAAAKLQEWARKGYFTPDHNGTSYDSTWQDLAKGKGRFMIAGTWQAADLMDQGGGKIRFMLMPPQQEGDTPTALGGESLPWAITSKSQHADVAGAYIDFLTDANAAKVLTQTGNLPAIPGAEAEAPKDGMMGDIFAAWKTLSDNDALVPYLDYSTPTFYDTLSGNVQKLTAGKMDAKAFTADNQADMDKFQKGQQ
jgi:raffinose/stachyose/melibiose transport system substrate-binding protein